MAKTQIPTPDLSPHEGGIRKIANSLHTQPPEAMSIAQCREIIDLFPPGDPDRPNALLGSGHILCRISEATGDLEAIAAAKSVLREALALHPPSNPKRTDCILHLIKVLAKSYDISGDRRDFEDTISLSREVIELISREDPRWFISYTNLASSLHERFRLLGEVTDLEECARCVDELLQMCDHGDSRRAFVVWLAVNVSTSYFFLTGNDEDIEKATLHHAELVQITNQSDPRYAGSHHHLASAYLSRFQKSNDPQDLDTCIELNETALRLRPIGHSDHVASLTNLADAILAQYTGSNDPEVLHRAISLREEILNTLPDDHPEMWDALLLLADGLYIRFKRFSSILDLQRAVDLRRTALTLCLPEHPAYLQILQGVAEATISLGGETGNLSDIDEGIRFYEELSQIEGVDDSAKLHFGHMYACLVRYKHSQSYDDLQIVTDAANKAISTLPPGDLNRHHAIMLLATALECRWQYSVEPEDLHTSIALHREALELQPNRITYSHTLAKTLFRAFLQYGNMLHLVESIGLHRIVLYTTSEHNPEYPTYLRDLAMVLLALVEYTEMNEALEESIGLLHRVVDLLPDGQVVRTDAHAKIAHAQVIRHRMSGSALDLDDAIATYQRLLSLPSCDVLNRAAILHDTGGALSTRYECSHNISDLQESIVLYEEFLSLPDAASQGSGRLIISTLRGLADSLWMRFVALGDINDFNRFISSYEQALALCRKGDAERLPCLISYGVALHRRFELHGKMEDEEDSVRHLREAVQLCPKGHRHRSTAVKYLGGTLAARYFQIEDPSDLDDAINLLEESLMFYPEGRAGRAAALHDLASVLLARYNLAGDADDFDQAVEYHLQAGHVLQIETGTNSGPRHAKNMIGLSDAYYSHFMRSRSEGELDACIQLRREALENLPPGHYTRPKELHNLSVFLASRGSFQDTLDDFEEALSLIQQCLEERGLDHSERSLYFQSLASVHLRHFRRSGDQSHLDSSLSSFITGVEDNSRSARLRLNSAVDWFEVIELCQSITPSQRKVLLEAYEKTIQLLPRVAYFGLDVTSRLHALKESERLATDAAAHALILGKPETALELLEAGRAVFWTQVLRLRTPFDDLPPEVASELKAISRQLDTESHQGSLIHTSEPDEKRLVEEDVARRRRLSARFDELVEKVRGMEGFGRFLLNPQYSQLAKAAEKGPVVVLLASRHSCHAIVIKESNSAEGILLPSVSHDKLEKLGRAARGSGGTFRNVGIDDDIEHLTERAGRKNVTSNANPLLGYLWQQVVKPVIECLGLKVI